MKEPARPTTRFARLTWPLRHPVIAAMALVLFLDSLPWQKLHPLITPPGKTGFAQTAPGLLVSAECYVVRDGGGWTVVDPDRESWDLLSQLVSRRPQDLLQARFESTVARHGWWHATHISGERRIVLEPLPTGPLPTPGFSRPGWPFTEQELSQARAAYWAYIDSRDSAFAAGLDAHDTHVFRLLPLGLAANAGSASLFAVLVFSFAGMPRYLRVAKARRRLNAGRCGMCNYDISEIDPTDAGVRCPECGILWDPSWFAHAPDRPLIQPDP